MAGKRTAIVALASLYTLRRALSGSSVLMVEERHERAGGLLNALHALLRVAEPKVNGARAICPQLAPRKTAYPWAAADRIQARGRGISVP